AATQPSLNGLFLLFERDIFKHLSFSCFIHVRNSSDSFFSRAMASSQVSRISFLNSRFGQPRFPPIDHTSSYMRLRGLLKSQEHVRSSRASIRWDPKIRTWQYQRIISSTIPDCNGSAVDGARS